MLPLIVRIMEKEFKASWTDLGTPRSSGLDDTQTAKRL